MESTGRNHLTLNASGSILIEKKSSLSNPRRLSLDYLKGTTGKVASPTKNVNKNDMRKYLHLEACMVIPLIFIQWKLLLFMLRV